MVEENKKSTLLLYEILIPVICILLSSAAGFLYKLDSIDLVKNAAFVGIVSIALSFVIELSNIKKSFRYDNAKNFGRFFGLFLLFTAVSLICPLVPSFGWIYLCIFISLSLFSNEIVGIVSGTLLLLMSILLSGSEQYIMFIIYIIPGIVAVMVFSTIDEEFKVVFPMIISVIFQFLALCTGQIIMTNKKFSLGMLLIPGVNIFICVAILLIVLKIFSFMMIYKTHDRYMDIIDPEFSLLVRLKDSSKDIYNHTIYTAVLCSKLAEKMQMDVPLVKALGYYHKIGTLTDSKNWEDTEELLIENEIPNDVIKILKEYSQSSNELKSREAIVLMFSDTVVSSIRYLFSKDKNAVIDYEKLVNAVFEKKLSSKVISNSKISFEDINVMKKTLMEEKLFYDFLR